jgi:uncharacterized damage-inducible protein DinB
MNAHPYLQIVRYKQWADRGLYQVVADRFERLDPQDGAILLRVLDHIHVVDRVFQHHLQGTPHRFHAPKSDVVPDLQTLASGATQVDDWDVAYVRGLPQLDFEEPVDFAFTNGNAARMTRGEIVLHVCMHGTYHRGNAGILLQKNGIAPNDDRITDFLEAAAPRAQA